MRDAKLGVMAPALQTIDHVLNVFDAGVSGDLLIIGAGGR